MSGIAGLFYLDGHEVDPSQIRRMTDRLAHRGPDGVGAWCGGSVGLGHRMLHTTPESLAECLPWATGDGSVVITADARIDNRDELRAVLGKVDAGADTPGDGELILSAYLQWGESCVERLLGDFAFAIWDGRRDALFCARDHVGVKPFYYSVQPGRLIGFASEIKGVLALSEVPDRLNEIRLGEYLANQGRSDREATVYEGITRLPPGSRLVATRSGVRTERYWRPTVRAPSAVLSDDEYAEQFREIFTEAVRCRLRSVGPVASELSGGLDSSYVTCVARDLVRGGSEPLHTISLIYDTASECDERAYIDAVLQEGGVVAHLAPGDTFGPLTHLEEIFDHLDDGFTGGNHHMVWECCRVARENGIRVVLDGVDGDTVVSHGLEYFAELARAGEWARFAEESSAAHRLMRDASEKQSFHEVLGSPRDLLIRYGFAVLEEQARRGELLPLLRTVWQIHRHFEVRTLRLLKIFGRRAIATRRRRAVPEVPRPSPAAHLNADFVRRTGLDAHLGSERQPPRQSVREAQSALLESDVFARSLELVDHYGAAHGLEFRHPFMDRRLIEFCLALPPEQSLRAGWTRWIMRNAMRGQVPEKIRTRLGKTDLSASFDLGLFELDAHRLSEALAPRNPLERYVEPEHLREVLERGSEQPARDVWMLCLYAILSIWLSRKGTSSRDGEDGSPASSLVGGAVVGEPDVHAVH